MTSTTATASTALTSPADATAAAARLRLAVARLARQLRQQSNVGLTPTQLSALAAIERHGPLALGRLATHERVSAPTITRVVAKLEADDLVIRADDPVDRRATVVSVTRAGRALLRRTRTRKDAWLADRISQLEPQEVVALTEALGALEHLVDLDRAPA